MNKARERRALSTSALAARTVESGAAGLRHSLNAAVLFEVAVAARAGFARALINRPFMLEITEFAVGLHVVAQGRAAGRYRFGQHILDGLCQRVRPVALHGASKTPRRQAGMEQRLGCIDVAHAGDDALIE